MISPNTMALTSKGLCCWIVPGDGKWTALARSKRGVNEVMIIQKAALAAATEWFPQTPTDTDTDTNIPAPLYSTLGPALPSSDWTMRRTANSPHPQFSILIFTVTSRSSSTNKPQMYQNPGITFMFGMGSCWQGKIRNENDEHNITMNLTNFRQVSLIHLFQISKCCGLGNYV